MTEREHVANLLVGSEAVHKSTSADWEGFLPGSCHLASPETLSVAKGDRFVLTFEARIANGGEPRRVQWRFNYWDDVNYKYADVDSGTPSVEVTSADWAVYSIPLTAENGCPSGYEPTVLIQISWELNGTEIEFRRPMLSKGPTPAAWAPADGETIAVGGGASMTRELIAWNGRKEALASNGRPSLNVIPLAEPIACGENVPVYFQAWFDAPTVRTAIFQAAYADSAGNVNWADDVVLAGSGGVCRASSQIVVPSGMKITQIAPLELHDANDAAVKSGEVYGLSVSLGGYAHTALGGA